jgi:predicted GIY-YIG superfamily endonuclease
MAQVTNATQRLSKHTTDSNEYACNHRRIMERSVVKSILMTQCGPLGPVNCEKEAEIGDWTRAWKQRTFHCQENIIKKYWKSSQKRWMPIMKIIDQGKNHSRQDEDQPI